MEDLLSTNLDMSKKNRQVVQEIEQDLELLNKLVAGLEPNESQQMILDLRAQNKDLRLLVAEYETSLESIFTKWKTATEDLKRTHELQINQMESELDYVRVSFYFLISIEGK